MSTDENVRSYISLLNRIESEKRKPLFGKHGKKEYNNRMKVGLDFMKIPFIHSCIWYKQRKWESFSFQWRIRDSYVVDRYKIKKYVIG